MDVLAAAPRALELTLVVFFQRKNHFIGLLAILAIKLVMRHWDLQTLGPQMFRFTVTPASAGCQGDKITRNRPAAEDAKAQGMNTLEIDLTLRPPKGYKPKGTLLRQMRTNDNGTAPPTVPSERADSAR